MFNSNLEFLGWCAFFEKDATDHVDLFPARVIGEEKNMYRVQTSIHSTMHAHISGKMQFNALSRKDYPAVGDWVWVDVPPQSDRAVIHAIAPRKSVIYRKAVTESDAQILATNVDTVFVATSMNEDLNMPRLDRYLTMVWESGASPVILLTKADLCDESVAVVLDRV